VVVGDFDIGRSFSFPFEADSILVVDPNAELAFAAAPQRFKPVAAKRSQVVQGSRGVEADQASSRLLFDVHQFNNAPAVLAIEKLGLKLEVHKRPEPVLVVDHLEEKPADN